MYSSHRGMAPQPGNQRLDDLLGQIRQEYLDSQRGSNEHDHQVHQQMQEMELIRSKIFNLEQQHNQMKAKYEDEIARLRHELEQRSAPIQSSGAPSQPPPAIGHGGGNLFQGIMSGSAAQGGPGLAPPQQEQQGQPGMPGQMHAPQGQGFQPPGPPQHPFGYGQGQPQSVPNGYAPPHHTASPGPARPTPPPQHRPLQHLHNQQLNGIGYTDADMERIGNTLVDYDPEKMPQAYKKQRPEDEWFAIFNPRAKRQLDVDLLHSIEHESVVCCVRFSQDGRYVATGCNRSAQIFEVSSGKEVCKLIDSTADMQNNDLYIRSVCFSPDGRFLATGAEDKLIRVWNIETTQIIRRYSGHEMDIYSLDFSSDSRHIVSGSGDRTVRVWDFSTEAQILSMSITDGVTTVAFSPNGRSIAAGSLDRGVRVWDIETGAPRDSTDENEGGHKDSVYSVAFTPDGRYLVSGSLDRTVKMWELSDPSYHNPNARTTETKCIRTFEGHNDYVLSVALTPDGAWVMSGSKDRGVQFWDPQTGQAQMMLQGHKNSVISVAPSPRGGLFATGSGDNKARIWRYDAYRG